MKEKSDAILIKIGIHCGWLPFSKEISHRLKVRELTGGFCTCLLMWRMNDGWRQVYQSIFLCGLLVKAAPSFKSLPSGTISNEWKRNALRFDTMRCKSTLTRTYFSGGPSAIRPNICPPIVLRSARHFRVFYLYGFKWKCQKWIHYVTFPQIRTPASRSDRVSTKPKSLMDSSNIRTYCCPK